MHHMDTNETHGGNARREPHKNAMCYFEQILEAILRKTATVWLLTSYLRNYSNKTNKTGETLLEEFGWTHKWRSAMGPYTWTSQYWTTSHNLFTSDTGCSLEDLLRAMGDRNDREKGARKFVLSTWFHDDDDENFVFIFDK